MDVSITGQPTERAIEPINGKTQHFFFHYRITHTYLRIYKSYWEHVTPKHFMICFPFEPSSWDLQSLRKVSF